MPIPVVKSLGSLELARDAVPDDPHDCAVAIDAEIGFREEPGGDRFSFVAITPRALERDGDVRWGRGYLLMPAFSWKAVERALDRLLMHAHRPTWREAASELAKELHWEFEHYTP